MLTKKTLIRRAFLSNSTAMKIRKLKIHNWRSIKDLEIELQDLMVFVGQNNHGKSNVLSAILFFFGSISCSDSDFNKDAEEAFVEITFDNLDDQDKSKFVKYLDANSLFTVSKQISKGETATYHGYLDAPQDDWLKEENAGNYATRDAISAIPLNTLVPTTGRITKDMVQQAQVSYISANRADITFSRTLEAGTFLGSKSLPQGIFGEMFFVPAVKNAADDLSPKGKSPFNNLLASVINDMSASNAEYISAKEQIRQLTNTLNKRLADGSSNTGRPEQIARLESLLEVELASWDTKIDIEITPPDVDEIMKVGTSVSLDDGVSTDVNRKGNGLQRSLIFALIKAWAKVSLEEKQKAEALMEAEEGAQKKASKSIYFIFEEPELYLHPQAQRELFSSLKKLALTENQVFLTTHSSSFIDLGLYRSICIICKNSITEGTKSLQCLVDLFADVAESKKFNLTYWINPDRGEMFFAKKVILVEGATDKSAIAFIAKRIDCFKYDYTLVDCGAKDNLPLYIQLLNHFNLPYIAVYDRDHQAGKGVDAIASADQSSARIEAAVDARFGSTVVLENDIEEEIGIVDGGHKNKPYIALEHMSAEGYTYPDPLKAKIIAIYS